MHRCTLILLVACGGAAAHPTTAASYRACADAYNARAWTRLASCYAPDVVQDEPGTGKPWRGIAEAIGHLQHFVASFPDNTSTPALTLVHDRDIVSIASLRGTNDGAFPGIGRATHRPIALSLAHVVALDAAGKIRTEWILYDTLTMLSQLGLSPAPARPPLGNTPAPEVVVADGRPAERANLEAHLAAIAAWNARDEARFAAGLADDLVWSELAQPADLDKAGAVRASREAWTQRSVASSWAAGDYTVVIGQETGHRADRALDLTYVEIAHFTAGKRDRSWLFSNGIVAAEQLQ